MYSSRTKTLYTLHSLYFAEYFIHTLHQLCTWAAARLESVQCHVMAHNGETISGETGRQCGIMGRQGADIAFHSAAAPAALWHSALPNLPSHMVQDVFRRAKTWPLSTAHPWWSLYDHSHHHRHRHYRVIVTAATEEWQLSRPLLHCDAARWHFYTVMHCDTVVTLLYIILLLYMRWHNSDAGVTLAYLYIQYILHCENTPVRHTPYSRKHPSIALKIYFIENDAMHCNQLAENSGLNFLVAYSLKQNRFMSSLYLLSKESLLKLI